MLGLMPKAAISVVVSDGGKPMSDLLASVFVLTDTGGVVAMNTNGEDPGEMMSEEVPVYLVNMVHG